MAAVVAIRYREEPSREGGVRVWEAPRHGAEYTIGIDSAGGGAAGDPAAACVIENASRALVAAYWKRRDPVLLADDMALLGTKYNEALLAFETRPSTFGLTACRTAIELGYGHVYRQNRLQLAASDPSMNLGWHTDATGKSEIIECVKVALRDQYVIPSRELGLEMALRQWIGNEDKDHADKFRFGGRGHDDLVIAYGITLAVRKLTWSEPANYAPRPPPKTDTELIWQHHEQEMASFAERPRRRRVYAWL